MFLSATLGLVTSPAVEAHHELRVLTVGNTAAIRDILDVLAKRYAGLPHSNNARALSQRAGPGIYLAIGPAALQAGLEADLQPMVSLFTSSQTYHQVLAAAGGRGGRLPAVTAIYAEVSPQAQLEVVAALYQRRLSVGVLLSDLTARLEPLLRRSAERLSLDLVIHRVATGANVVRELNQLSSATALLAVPDSQLYTRHNLGPILESTYRRGQPVIGFSPALVNAGMLASAYASMDDIAAHLDELVLQIDAGRTPEPQYPLYWRVAINEHVARSLAVVVRDETRELGKRPPRRSE